MDRNFPLTVNLYEIRDQNNYNSSNPSFVLTKNCDANMPKIFEFKNLREYTKYLVVIKNQVNYYNE